MQQHTFPSICPAKVAFNDDRRVRFSARGIRSTLEPRALKRTLRASVTTIVGSILVFASALHAQPATQPATAPTTRRISTGPSAAKLTIHPSAVAQPIRQYKLLPDLAEQAPGDAVPLYLMTRYFWPDGKTTNEILYPENEKYDYLSTPTDKFPPQYAQRVFDGYAQTLAYADQAARMREAHWNTGWQEFGFADPLSSSYLNSLRHVANLLSFKARVQILHGDWVGAQRSLQTGLSMSQHMGQTPLLIHAMVEYGFAEIELSDPANEWISHVGSPNLYWALTDLPQPYIPLRPVAQWERLELRYSRSLISQALRGDLPADQWPAAIREMVAEAQSHTQAGKKPDEAQADQLVSKLLAASFARSGPYLIAHGQPAEKIQAMSREQSVGRYWCEEYQQAHDELWKYWAFEYPRASQYMMQTWRSIAVDRPPALENPLIQSLLITFNRYGLITDYPMLLRARYYLTRTDRQIAMLRIIEALRDYAAHHDGKPPERLDQITDLPIPLDPITGKDFTYHADGQVAVLEAVAPPMMSKASGWRFELTFVK